MSDKIRAPFTPEQIDALTTYQTAGFMHPFTCGGGGGLHSGVSLYAQADGWHCPVEGCTHRQDWAHTFMADRRYWPDIRTGREVSAMSDDNRSRDEGARCSTPCDPDCDAVCHESHVAGHKKQHWPYDCPAADDYVWGGNDFTGTAIKRLRAERDDARRQLAAANARVQHAETERDQAYRSRDASSTVQRRLIKEARDQRDKAREYMASIGDPETEVQYLLADGTKSEFDPHNGPCDCVRQTRLVHEGPWLASGGWAHLANGPVRWDIGCVFPMPSRAGVEADRAVTIKMRSSEDVTADTEPGGSFWADLRRRLRDEPEFREGYIETSLQIQAADAVANAQVLTCPFCRIVSGTSTTQPFLSWDDAVAITPLNPVVPGHMLVIPNRHVPDAAEDPDVTGAVMRRAAELAAGRGDMNLITSIGPAATQTVRHLHIHLVPRVEGDGLTLPWTGQERSA